MDYLVPDYYPAFRCKIGDCRNVCCNGWPVTFSMGDYFRLLGVDCSPETKATLDRALHLTKYPTEEEYAMILPRYDGNCPLRMEDGRCALQAEAGEEALPAVCRLYPRGFREAEAACSNSCEAVAELLRRERPISFVHVQLKTERKLQPRVHFFETGGCEQEIRLWLIGFVQDRRFSLPQRLNRLGEATRHMENVLKSHDAQKIRALLDGRETIEAPSLSGNTLYALKITSGLLDRLDGLSDSIRLYGQQALAAFARDKESGSEEALSRLKCACPHWEAWFENLIVNHMFFSQFPFQDRPVSLADEVIALYSVYALLRFLTIGAGNGTPDRLADIVAALFRLVDHTAFDRYAVPILKEMCKAESYRELLNL